MRCVTVTQLARGTPFRGRHNARQLVAIALVVHRETELAYQCSTDGRRPEGRDGWLPKRAIVVSQHFGPSFIVAEVPSRLLTEKNLFGMQSALNGEWTDEDRCAWESAQTLAAKMRCEFRRARRRSSDRQNARWFA